MTMNLTMLEKGPEEKEMMELRQDVKLKIPFGRRRGLMKFPVALCYDFSGLHSYVYLFL